MRHWLLAKTNASAGLGKRLGKKLGQHGQTPFGVSINRIALFVSFFVVTIIAVWRIKYKILGATDPYIFRDFLYAYYPAGRLIIEEPSKLFAFTRAADGTLQPVIYGFVNLPIIAYLFTPFSFLGQNVANILYFGLGIAAVILSTWMLVRLAKLKGWQLALFVVLVGINAPIFNSLWLGNSTHILFPILIAVFICFRGQKYSWSGLFLAITGLIKIPLCLPLLYFILKQRWLAVAGFIATITGVLLASILVCGLPLNITWFESCILSFSGKAVAGDTLQSVDSFLIRLLSQASIDSFDPIEVDWRFKLLRYSLFAFLMGGTVLTVLRSRRGELAAIQNLEFSSFLTLALVVSPISWTHYYLLLLLPIALYLGGCLAIPKQWPWTLAMGLSIALVIAPNVRTSPLDHPLVNIFTRHFLVSHYFWGGVLMLGVFVLALLQQPFQQPLVRQNASHVLAAAQEDR
jgi:Glycosyltransferase family 87